MIALVEKGILEVEEARSALEDAAAAHQVLTMSDGNGQAHDMAAQMIEGLITQMNAANQPAGRDRG